MAISKPILEQTLDEFEKQMSVNGNVDPTLVFRTLYSIIYSQWRCLLLQVCRRGFQAPGQW